MTWRDDKFPASLNGVRFHVESTRKRGGRRTAAHEFADVDEAYVEDSGAAPQRHEVTAFLLGDDYHVVRQRLEDVLELGGPLELHHPDRGIIENLRLEGEYVSENRRDQQGYATITFTLVQDGAAIPLVFDDERGKVQRACVRVLATAGAAFESSWQPSPLDVVSNAFGWLNGKLAGAYSGMLTQLGPVSHLQRELRSFHNALAKLKASPRVFAAAFRGLVRTIMNTIGSRARELGRLATEFGSPADLLVEATEQLRSFAADPSAQAQLAALGPGPTGTWGPKQLVAKTDLDALELLVGATVLAAAIEAALLVPLPTAQAALQLAEYFDVALADLLAMQVGLEPIEPELYQALLGLAAQAGSYLNQAGQLLPQIGTLVVSSNAPVSALLVAFWRFGPSPALGVKLDELLAANPEVDPLAIEPGVELAVLGV